MSESLPAPRLAEAYEVLELVRRGSLSTTFRVRHRGSGELRCIDVLRPAPGEREALERRLDADARPLMELRHPHVVRLVDAAVGDEGRACLVREDHEGVTLRRLTGSPLPSVPLALELMRQAADAVAFLHEHGREVGNLSPEGLLVGRGPDGAPRLVIADLGLAKDWQEEAALTAAGLFLGQLRYKAPEQFEAVATRGPAGDVYALGLVAYETLTGVHPIEGDSASSLIAGHLFRPPKDFAASDPENRVPESLREVALSVLAKEAAQRPTASELRDEFAQLQDTIPAVDPSEMDRWIDPRHPRQVSTEPSDLAGSSTVALPTASSSADASRTVALPSRPAASAVPDVPDEAQLEAWLEEARALAREEEFLDARDKVRKVLKVQPDHSMGLMLLASLEACLKIQVEESKAHQTLVVGPGTQGSDGASEAETLLRAGQQTMQIPTRGEAADTSQQALGTETVRVTAEDLRKMVAEGGERLQIDEEMATQRLQAVSQVPGGPASTERLDLDRDPSTVIKAQLDDDKTRPLSPEMRQGAAEGEAASGPEVLANGTTQMLGHGSLDGDLRPGDPQPGAQGPADPASRELPGTVTMPMEALEEQKRRVLGGPTLPELRQQPAESPTPTPKSAPTPTPAPTPTQIPPPPPRRTQAAPQEAPSSPPPTASDSGHPASFAQPTPTPRPDTFAQAPAPVQSAPEPQHVAPTPPPTDLEDAGSRNDPPSTAPPRTAAPRTEPPATAPPASVEELGFGGGGSPAPALAERAPRGRSRRRGKGRRSRRGNPGRRGGGTMVLLGAAIAAVLVFAIGYAIAAGVDLRQLVGLSETEQIVPPSELPPVEADPGWLVLDAAPWAEIVQIIDPLGEEVPLRFRHTPARYELAPGSYSVVVSSPDGEPQTLEVEVVSGQAIEARPEFAELSADDYFRLMEW